MRRLAQDPRSTAAAWWTFGGILLSMFAATAGSLAGSGPTINISSIRVRHTVVGVNNPSHQPVGR